MIGVVGLEGGLGHSDIRPRIIVSFDSSFIDGALGLAFAKRTELVSKCWHASKYLLSNFLGNIM